MWNKHIVFPIVLCAAVTGGCARFSDEAQVIRCYGEPDLVYLSWADEGAYTNIDSRLYKEAKDKAPEKTFYYLRHYKVIVLKPKPIHEIDMDELQYSGVQNTLRQIKLQAGPKTNGPANDEEWSIREQQMHFTVSRLAAIVAEYHKLREQVAQLRDEKVTSPSPAAAIMNDVQKALLQGEEEMKKLLLEMEVQLDGSK